MKGFRGKRVLVLGGSSVHCKLVQAAHALGLYVIVADYLPSSPAKKIADEDILVDVYDVDALEAHCRKRGVEAVLNTHLDPSQRPYCQLCERLNLPCIGNAEMVFKMTDKVAFKQMCRENGVPVIDEYTKEDILTDNCVYPLFVKPVDSRGSRGQRVCRTREEAIAAIREAEDESSNGKCIIERFISSGEEVQITYFFVDGEPHLIRTVDSYTGNVLGLEKVVLCAVSPSVFTDVYLKTTHKAVVRMLKKMGMQNGPVFMQGFYDGGVFRFFDPGLRFPGVDYEKIFAKVFGVNLLKCLWEFALMGKLPEKMLTNQDYWNLKGKAAAVLFPVMKAGTIARIRGMENVDNDNEVIAYSLRHTIGETVPWSMNINQRYAEVDLLADNKEQLISAIERIQGAFFPVDMDNESLAFAPFPVSRILQRNV